MMIIGRIGQGFTGGAMIPTAQTIIAMRLPRHQQPLGTALFGVTAVLGPVIGPALGGWLTETVSWHWAFFLNVPVCFLLLALLFVGLPYRRPRFEDLAEADYLGIVGLMLALGSLTVVLEEGQREDWFSSSLIVWLTVLSAIGFGLLFLGQKKSPRPVIRLDLLLDKQFGSVVGMVIYGTSYVIPQFLAMISGYNSYQAGLVVLLSGVPSLIFIAITPILIRLFDIRVAVAIGMTLLAVSAYLETHLTPASNGSDFVDSQLLRGAGTIFVLLFLNQAAIQSVPRQFASDAAGLYNAARNLGGSLALAGISTIQERRFNFHYERLVEGLNPHQADEVLSQLTARFGNSDSALRQLSKSVQTQALTITFTDLFWILTIGIVCVAPLLVFLRPLQQGRKIEASH